MLRVFGCMVASRGGYRMARGWHYAKLSLSNAPRLSFSGLCVCVCVFSSHPFWTSSSLDVPAGVTQEEGHTGFF